MEHLDVGPLKTARGTIKLPGSKSISTRVLLLAVLAQGETVVRDLLDSDDTRVASWASRSKAWATTRTVSPAPAAASRTSRPTCSWAMRAQPSVR